MAEHKKIGCGFYILASLSFIPLIGIIFAIISIVIGFIYRKKGGFKIMSIGVCGLLLTAITYGTLLYFGFIKKDGLYDDLRNELAQSQLMEIAQMIDYYYDKNGHMPKNLEVLKQEYPNEPLMIQDVTIISIDQKDRKNYYYEIMDDEKSFLLFAYGRDNTPFTKDDVEPSADSKVIMNSNWISRDFKRDLDYGKDENE